MELDQIVDALARMGVVLELQGANPFKARAFSSAARTLKRLEGALELIDAGKIDTVKGIGKSLAADIAAMRSSGRFEALEEVAADVPPGVFDILSLPGLGPKKVRTIWTDLGATNLGELEYACLENRLKDLKGFGATTQEKVLAAIDFAHRNRGLQLMNVAWLTADDLLDALGGVADVAAVAVVGGVRRAKLVTRDVDLLVAHPSPEAVGAALEGLEELSEVTAASDDQRACRWLAQSNGLPVEVLACAPDDWGWALAASTGSREHVEALEARGASTQQSGASKLGTPGVRLGPGHTEAPPEEVALYESLGLAWEPPEVRESGTLREAGEGPSPALLTREDIAGVWHNHTDWSDGSESLEEMAEAADERGLSFLGISDHSGYAVYAHGLDAKRLKAQGEAIAKLKTGSCRVLHGLEADILSDGSVDLSGQGLEDLDFCIASVHSVFGMKQEEMTDRVVSAIRDPAVTMLGHATGRLLLSREGFALDMDAVLDACVEYEVVPELNANPHRLDLDTEALRSAKTRGLKVAINPDAHHAGGLDDLRYGIAAARRAGLTAEDVLNCEEPAS
ncbi:MAG: PHP domain-containing protein [Planctomycetota bacterium]|nr:PHP domain-containing protein [Planctomycetota bacterium]